VFVEIIGRDRFSFHFASVASCTYRLTRHDAHLTVIRCPWQSPGTNSTLATLMAHLWWSEEDRWKIPSATWLPSLVTYNTHILSSFPKFENFYLGRLENLGDEATRMIRMKKQEAKRAQIRFYAHLIVVTVMTWRTKDAILEELSSPPSSKTNAF